MMRLWKGLAAGIVMAIVALAGGQHALGQAAQTAPAPSPATLRRPPAARPDLTGIWQALTPANHDIQDHSAEDGIPAGQGIVEGNEIPYLPAAAAKKAENSRNRKALDPENMCYMQGVPRMMYSPFPFQILQSPTFTIMVSEFNQETRRIHVDGTKHPEGMPDTWMGDSRGRWEGDTFVVDTTGFNDQTWFDRAGNHHSDALHTVERFTLKGKDHIDYEVTIEDPKTFSRPWKMRTVLYRRLEKNVQLLEYPCVSFLEDAYEQSLKK